MIRRTIVFAVVLGLTVAAVASVVSDDGLTVAAPGVESRSSVSPKDRPPDATATAETDPAGEEIGSAASDTDVLTREVPPAPAGSGPASGGGDPIDRSTDPTPPTTGPTGAGPTGAAPTSPVREVLPGAGSPPASRTADPIGALDDTRPVPPALGLTAPPRPAGATTPGHGGPGGLAVAPSCSHQCITRGVAYPRGIGAELVVETEVPAKLLMTAIADLDHDGDYEDVHVESVPYAVTEHSWPLDHLEPGQTYYVMATATDRDGHTAYVWGEFTTLARRDVFIVFGDSQVYGGPGNINSTSWWLGFDGVLANVTPGQQGILLHKEVPRYADIDFTMVRGWHRKVCESWVVTSLGGHGHDEGSCVTWNSTALDPVDLDRIPTGPSRWTQTSVGLTLHPPTGAGGALPPGSGDPFWFWFEVPVTLYVDYS